ncbi:MAG: aminotransferase class I/II-fold pyridoxal phosphate-dependent enzyme [Nitritalea sp.]
MSTSLSSLGRAAAQSPSRVDLNLYFEGMQNRYHPTKNPQGKLLLNVAENLLNWPFLQQRLHGLAAEEAPPEWAATYGDPAGVPEFRSAIADFLGEHLFAQAPPAETIATAVGATSIIEMSAFLLADPEDVAAIPAPAYPVYRADLQAFARVRRVDIPVADTLAHRGPYLDLPLSAVEEQATALRAKGKRMRMLILTQPDNPTGGIYREAQLEQLAQWCMAQEVHLIVNEIYGLSQLDWSHPELAAQRIEKPHFCSFGTIMARHKSPYLHLWYAFSKDLGLSGFRVGVLHSYSEALIQAFRNTALTHGMSNYTQWILTRLLADKAFMQEFLTRHKKALTDAFVQVARAFAPLQVPYFHAAGSLFAWFSLQDCFPSGQEPDEEALWLRIYEETGVLLTPTTGFGHRQKGYFRMVISGMSAEDLGEALARLTAFIQRCREAR